MDATGPDTAMRHELDAEGHDAGVELEELVSSSSLVCFGFLFRRSTWPRSTPEGLGDSSWAVVDGIARINTGGVPLSGQELRHTLIPGQARGLLREIAASKSFQDAVAHSVS